MIALLQRVLGAAVEVEGRRVSAIGHGLLVYVCAMPADTSVQVQRMAAKLLGLRVFADDAGRMNRSVQDVGGGLLVVSQFTLAAEIGSGQRPSLSGAAAPQLARVRYDELLGALRQRHAPVDGGVFGSHMRVSSVNDGPVTLVFRID